MANLQTSILKFRVAWGMLTRKPLPVRLRYEFNLWAGNGSGERMEHDHMPFAERMFARLQFTPEDRILDLACGEGWASRLLAGKLGGKVQLAGVDISDAMIRRASAKAHSFPNLKFECGAAHRLPYGPDSFDKAFCIESFYYFEDQDLVLQELLRVLRPGGELALLFCLYPQNPGCFEFLKWLRVPVHIREISDYRQMLERTGWVDVKTEEFVADNISPTVQRFHDRALLIQAKKPS